MLVDTDSWDLGQGAKTTALMCTCYAGAQPHAQGCYRNKRTVRVVLWANEEFGLDGAKEYARWAKENGVHHWVAMESDGGGDVPRGFGIAADDDRIAQVRTFKKLLSPYGLYVFAGGGGQT